jgi:purine-binding chemotaxis protein CheW
MAQLVPSHPVVIAVRLGDAATGQYLIFAHDSQMFAIGIVTVRKTLAYGQLTAAPPDSAFIRGLIDWRGSAVPVVDLSVRFGGRPTQAGQRTCIAIVEVRDDDSIHAIGLMIDAAPQAVGMPSGKAARPFDAGGGADFIFAVGRVAGKLAIALGLDELLSAEEIARFTATTAVPGSAINRLLH